MRLYVEDKPIDEDVSFDVVRMSVPEFNSLNNQPFIICSKFDEVIIDVSRDININIVKYVMKVTKVIPRIGGELNSHSVALLCELYKEKAAEIRFNFLRDKEKFETTVNTLKTQYEWEKFYG